jgi:phage pi2 protein 07
MKQNKIENLGDITIIYSSNTNDKILIDTEDYEIIKNYCWSIKEDSPLHRYARARERGTKRFVLMHRIITKELGIVDHVNHNTLDNRKCNLNITDTKGNLSNKIDYAYANKGIFYNKKCTKRPWYSTYRGKFIGWFTTKEEAILARIDYLKERKIYVKGFDYHL